MCLKIVENCLIVKITENKRINEKKFLEELKKEEKKIPNLMFSQEPQFFTQKYKSA